MDSPTGVIPEAYMTRKSRKAVIAFLIAQAFPGHIKRDYLFAWARTVGVRLAEREVTQVEQSGIEQR
jgi:hypothetical protein